MKKVTVYSTPTCHYCGIAKKFFTDNKIKFEVVDVSKNPEKQKELREMAGSMTVPVITVGDRVFVGFSPEAQTSISKELGIE